MPMKREKQYDMFDVATGACTLDDYLFQRYSENDLSSTFWVDEKDEVDELRAPKPTADGRPGTEPEVIPIQGPRALKKPGPPKPPPLPEGLEPDSPPGPTQTDFPRTQAPEPVVADGQDMLQRGAPTVPAPGMETFQPNPPPSAVDGNDSFQTSSTPEKPPEPSTHTPNPQPEDGTPKPPSMEDLLARFHQATKDYEQRAQHEPPADEDQGS